MGFEDKLASAERRKQIIQNSNYESFFFDFSNPVKEPETIIDIEGNIISTPGNITGIFGASKSGKSGVSSALLAGAIAPAGSLVNSILNVKKNTEGKLILHIDSEQSRYNHSKQIISIIERSGRNSQPEWFKSALLRTLSPQEKRAALKYYLEEYSKQFQGVHLILIDGAADFVQSVNDEEQCNGLISEFEGYAIKYNCPIVTILHFNPGSTEKGRGHLGSALERKCESVLGISKDKDSEISTIEGRLLRNAGLIPNLQFKYNLDLGYHISCGFKTRISRDEQKKAELKELADIIFNGGKLTLKYSELTKAIMEEDGVKIDSAKKKIKEMKDHQIISYHDYENKIYQLLNIHLRTAV